MNEFIIRISRPKNLTKEEYPATSVRFQLTFKRVLRKVGNARSCHDLIDEINLRKFTAIGRDLNDRSRTVSNSFRFFSFSFSLICALGFAKNMVFV